MPDTVLHLKAVCAAAGASALFVLALSCARRPASAARVNAACVLAIGLGLALGCQVLQLPLSWPPASGLDRLLTIVFPAVIAIELIAALRSVPRWFAWSLRIGLAAAIGRILLHGSVYLAGSPGHWTAWQTTAVLTLAGASLAAQWGLLGWLSQRRWGVAYPPTLSIPLSLSLAGLCGGVTVMMAGYVTGGEAAVPPAAALVGATAAASLIAPRSGTPGAIGIGVVGLFGLSFIGLFFGGLTAGRALTLLFAPLLCWATELPLLRGRKPWQVCALRLALVAIPLVAVLALAKRDFDRDMVPLLGVASRDSVSR
ncbi:MAG TPA: hypothetical protein VND64_22150 [Pirellulales bacterium]|nr:hypothetical protein [Pirellulales bacterium]